MHALNISSQYVHSKLACTVTDLYNVCTFYRVVVLDYMYLTYGVCIELHVYIHIHLHVHDKRESEPSQVVVVCCLLCLNYLIMYMDLYMFMFSSHTHFPAAGILATWPGMFPSQGPSFASLLSSPSSTASWWMRVTR